MPVDMTARIWREEMLFSMGYDFDNRKDRFEHVDARIIINRDRVHEWSDDQFDEYLRLARAAIRDIVNPTVVTTPRVLAHLVLMAKEVSGRG